MKEILKINLDNEMDLILAHKRSMKIGEMCGMPVSAQTRFSTALSEVARCSISNGKNSLLVIGINVIRSNQKEILAVLTDSVDLQKSNPEAYKYASKISGNLEYEYADNQYITKLSQVITAPGLLSDVKIKSLVDYFKYEPALSPYDEIRKKNIELIALSEKLAESENRYRKLADTIPVLICVVNERNQVLLSNTSLQEYLHAPLTVFDKKTISSFIHSGDVQDLFEGWSKARKDGLDFFAEIRIKKDSSYIWHVVSIVLNKAEDGTFSSWLISFVNINAQKMVAEALKDNSELKEIQLELESANSKLKFKNKELEQFAFVASHDLQEPLRKIRIMLSRAAEHLTEEQKSLYYFDKITMAAARLSNLISDVLNYSRINNNDKSPLKVNLNKIISETLDDLSMVIEEKNAVLHIDTMPLVEGVDSQLRQLFYNLINNALKFNTSQPTVTITAAVMSAADSDTVDIAAPTGSYDVISIADNGIGMDSEYSGRIFDMFQRLHERDQYGGNGIGLALCRRIIENHNGVLNFTSKPQEGTTFWIYLPRN
ncbi:ATP-binding protein [Flavobacterium sp. CLA17]|uniref:sensor histidine kinase n=1 Tax=Flavobacterium sp. CLA17 TaxID=2724135 RepID=UPI001492CAF9|nr:ATP-binding protein [Flavobacterium sp. CLA17]QSB25432.1 PAS domain S-box protein [Flavobacterium sp. CLA17]